MLWPLLWGGANVQLELWYLIFSGVSAAVGYYIRHSQNDGPLISIVKKLLADADGDGQIDLLQNILAKRSAQTNAQAVIAALAAPPPIVPPAPPPQVPVK